MGFNIKRGRIPNNIKEAAKKYVDENGGLSYHYACYDCAFLTEKDRAQWVRLFGEEDFEKTIKYQNDFEYPFIDCVVKELKQRGLW